MQYNYYCLPCICMPYVCICDVSSVLPFLTWRSSFIKTKKSPKVYTPHCWDEDKNECNKKQVE